MATEEDSTPTRAQQFGEYVAAAARAAGYDIDSPRGGGKKALSERAGISHATVSRMLAGQTIPDPFYLERLAEALGVPLMELLVRSGVVSQNARRVADVLGAALDAPLTPESAARLLGIKRPDRVQAFTTVAKTLVDQEESDGEVRAGRGA